MSGDQLGALVRRVDEDRWLAARFAPARIRAHLNTLYALNYEIARTAETVTQSALGDIRLAWWREAIEEVLGGKTPRAHPVVQAFAVLVDDVRPAQETLDALITARGRDLEPEPFATWREMLEYVDATAGSVLKLAGQQCGGLPDVFVTDAGRAWGLVGLLRAAPFQQARGRRLAPKDAEPGQASALMLSEAKRAYHATRAAARTLPHTLFPSFGYLALCGGYLRRLGRDEPAETPLLRRQLKLIGASATGRL